LVGWARVPGQEEKSLKINHTDDPPGIGGTVPGLTNTGRIQREKNPTHNKARDSGAILEVNEELGHCPEEPTRRRGASQKRVDVKIINKGG